MHLVLGQATGKFGLTWHTTARAREMPPPYSLQYTLRSPTGVASKWFFSRDSRSGVPKLSRFGLPGLWDFVAPRPNLRSGRGLNQTCSPRRELFNAMSHSWSARWEQVDSRLLVVGSPETVPVLTPGPSFAHNLGCRCPNDQCEAILDIYTSRPFQWHQKHSNTRRFDPCNRALSFRESRRTPTSHFWECGLHPHTQPKVGLRHLLSLKIIWCLICMGVGTRPMNIDLGSTNHNTNWTNESKKFGNKLQYITPFGYKYLRKLHQWNGAFMFQLQIRYFSIVMIFENVDYF
jgi:hypothetical protein